jgi:uncharacterized membrane protein YoaK (UPF0700 family)
MTPRARTRDTIRQVIKESEVMPSDFSSTQSDGGISRASSTARRDMLLAGLAWTAGFVDAVSYLGLGNVFTANMTGNTVLLGIALGRGAHLAVLRSLAALAGFCIGVVAGALVVIRSDSPAIWPSSITNALALEVGALFALALGWHWAGAPADPGPMELLIVVSGFTMGVQSAAVRRTGVSAITSTAVTGTLAGVMAGAVGWLHHPVASSDQEHPQSARSGFRLSSTAWLAYALGGLAGGVIEVRWRSASMWPAVVVVGLVVAAAATFGRQSSRELPARRE